MAKKTTEQEMIRAALRRPERRWFFSWRTSRGRGDWPGKWSFFFDWNATTLSIGKPKKKFHGPEVTESQFNFSFKVRPFGIICFWGQERLFWIGDWAWKKSLRSG